MEMLESPTEKKWNKRLNEGFSKLPLRWKIGLMVVLTLAIGGGLDRSSGFKVMCYATQGVFCPENSKEGLRKKMFEEVHETRLSVDSTREDLKQVKEAINLLAKYTGTATKIKQDLHPTNPDDIFSITKN